MENGWIKLHRKIIESVVFKNEKCLKLWIWALSRANHKDCECLLGRKKITIKQGQFIMGGIKAEEILDIARTTIYYWLDFLVSEGMIDIKKTNKYTIITIKNWDKYQTVDIKKTSNDTTNGHQKDTDNKDKEYKEDKSIGIRDCWNSLKLPAVYGYRNKNAASKLLPECRKITPDIESILNKTTYTKEEIKEAIKKYAVEILNRDPANDYSNHRFSLYEFLKQKNGLVKFHNK